MLLVVTVERAGWEAAVGRVEDSMIHRHLATLTEE